MELSRGDKFDRYVIEELLGEGGMARVYRAHDPRLHRRVALKVLRLDSSFDPDGAQNALARVMREARAAAALDHPNAVSVFDVGEADGQLFIAMELVVGKNLRAYVGDPGVRWETQDPVDGRRGPGARRRARAGPRSPGREARERHGPDGRRREGARLRHRQAAARGRLGGRRPGRIAHRVDAGWPGRHAHVPVPEQLRGEPVDGRGRSVRVGRDDLRASHGHPAVAEGRRRLPARAGDPRQDARSPVEVRQRRCRPSSTRRS